MSTPAIDPKRTALLAMDFQHAMIAGVPDSDELLERVSGAIADVRAAGGTIGHVRVAFAEDDWAQVPETNKVFAPVAAAKMLHHEDHIAQIDGRVAPQDDDIVVRKVRIGGLSTTDLDRQLRDRGIDTLVLAGISTAGVILSTMTDAADRDYRIYVLSDGVADADADVHRVLIYKVFPTRAHVIDTGRLRELLLAA